jgi:hypothetical protein
VAGDELPAAWENERVPGGEEGGDSSEASVDAAGRGGTPGGGVSGGGAVGGVEEEAEFVNGGLGVVPVGFLGADDYTALEVSFDDVLLALGSGGGKVDQGAYIPCDECEVAECVRAGERREHLGGGRL